MGFAYLFVDWNRYVVGKNRWIKKKDEHGRRWKWKLRTRWEGQQKNNDDFQFNNLIEKSFYLTIYVILLFKKNYAIWIYVLNYKFKKKADMASIKRTSL